MGTLWYAWRGVLLVPPQTAPVETHPQPAPLRPSLRHTQAHRPKRDVRTAVPAPERRCPSARRVHAHTPVRCEGVQGGGWGREGRGAPPWQDCSRPHLTRSPTPPSQAPPPTPPCSAWTALQHGFPQLSQHGGARTAHRPPAPDVRRGSMSSIPVFYVLPSLPALAACAAARPPHAPRSCALPLHTNLQ